MELYTVKFVFLALTLDLSMAFLIEEVSTNQTSDLMTLLLQEKRERIQLEQRLGETEIRFQKFVDAVTAELKAERDKINILEQTINNCSSENEELHKDIAAVTSELQTAEMFILNKLDIDIKNATTEITNLQKDIQIINSELQIDRSVVKKVEANVNTSIVEFDKLVKEVQLLNLTLVSRLVNLSTSRKDNMVAFSVDGPDNSYHYPQPFYNQLFNIGGAYNTSTDRFTCKQPGVYVFMWNIIQSSSGSTMNCCLQINGYSQTCAVTGGGTGDHPSGSMSTIARLKTNDRVYLSCPSGTYYYYSGFSGFLLYPDN